MGKSQPTYTREFKQQAVTLFKTSGKSKTQIARDLGISDSALSKWCKEFEAQGQEAFPGKGHQTTIEEEMKRLKREIEILRQERDILKKAMSIFVELSQKKTLITHARTEAARFLGYEIVAQHNEKKRDRSQHRNLNGHIGLRLPNDVVEKKLALYMHDGKPVSRPELLFNEDYTIMSQYQSEYRGLVQYYLPAQNVSWLWRLHWIMQTSLLKTLASKHKSRVRKLFRKYRTLTMTPHGPMKCLEVVIERDGKKPLEARFGGIPLRQQKKVVLVDQDPRSRLIRRNELIKRLLVGKCELCQSTEDCEVHHIRKLADLKKREGKEKPAWVQKDGRQTKENPHRLSKMS